MRDGFHYYEYLMSLGDKRVENWGLMYSPLPTIFITIAYLLSELIVSVYNKTKSPLGPVTLSKGKNKMNEGMM